MQNVSDMSLHLNLIGVSLSSVSITTKRPLHVVVRFTGAMRGNRVLLSVKQTSTSGGVRKNMWAVDNFAVFRGDLDYYAEQIEDEFDPMQRCTWIDTSTARVDVVHRLFACMCRA